MKYTHEHKPHIVAVSDMLMAAAVLMPHDVLLDCSTSWWETGHVWFEHRDFGADAVTIACGEAGQAVHEGRVTVYIKK